MATTEMLRRKMKKKEWNKIQESISSREPMTESQGFENVEIEMTDEMFMSLALEAHNKDMKLNDFLVSLLEGIIKEEGYNLEVKKVVNDG